MGIVAVAAALIALVAPGVAGSQQFPGIFTVTTTADGNDGECNNDCTIREAVSLAPANQTTSISVPPGVYRLTQGPLILSNNVLLIGAGLSGGQGAGARTTIIDARGRSRVVEVPANSTGIIAGVTLTGGAADVGAGALVQADGILQLFNTVVEENTASVRGGGIAALGNVSALGTTIAGNRAPAGAGISIEPEGDGIILTTTVTGNTATGTGGGIASGGSLVMQNSTIAGNSAGSGGALAQSSTIGVTIWNTILAATSGGSCAAPLVANTASGNLTDDATCGLTPAQATQGDARLGSLRNNGGPTDTRALGAGSPAIDAGDPNLCGSPDQRGAAPVGNCDIGAFEFGGRPPEIQLPPPVAGETVNVTRARGTVMIKLPGGDEFFELQGGQQVPIGSEFDTSKGRVNLQAAGSQRAWFYQGVFKLGQTKGARPLSTLTLTGRLRCGGGKASTAAKRKKRRLWGDGSGKFRTKGKHSAATVVGTRWLVEDRCNGTLTKVRRGTVRVRDFRARKTVRVKAGRQYFARAK